MLTHNYAWLLQETCRKFDKFAYQYLKIYEHFYSYNFWPLVNILMQKHLEQNIGVLYITKKFVFGDQIC